jgi:tripartite-type tricarboxylate transporter receptor subunit TctC
VATDFTPIVNIAATPNMIAANPKFVGKDYKSFLAEIKKNPGKYSYGTPGTGSITHLMMEMFKLATDTEMPTCPTVARALPERRGGRPGAADFDNLPSTLPL